MFEHFFIQGSQGAFSVRLFFASINQFNYIFSCLKKVHQGGSRQTMTESSEKFNMSSHSILLVYCIMWTGDAGDISIL